MEKQFSYKKAISFLWVFFSLVALVVSPFPTVAFVFTCLEVSGLCMPTTECDTSIDYVDSITIGGCDNSTQVCCQRHAPPDSPAFSKEPQVVWSTIEPTSVTWGEAVNYSWLGNYADKCTTDFDPFGTYFPYDTVVSFSSVGERFRGVACWNGFLSKGGTDILVQVYPKIESFLPSESTVNSGNTVTLSWIAFPSGNDVRCRIDEGPWLDETGFVSQQVFVTTTFELQCESIPNAKTTNKILTSTKSTTVNVNVPPPLQLTFTSAPPNPVNPGTDVTLSWTATPSNGTKCNAPGNTGWVDPPSGNVTKTVIKTTMFNMECMDKDNKIVTKSLSVNIKEGSDLPTCAFLGGQCVFPFDCTGTQPNATGCSSKQVCCVGNDGGGGHGGGGGGGLTPCGNQIIPPGGDPKIAAEDCNFEKLINLAKAVIDFLLFKIAMPLAAISFAWAGWLYMSAMGNESKVSEAHRIFGYVVLGLCLALAAWLIVNAILSGLGVKDVFNSLKGGWGS